MVTGRKIEVEMKYQLGSPDAGDRYLVAPELGQLSQRGRFASPRSRTGTWIRPIGPCPGPASPRDSAGRAAKP